MSGFGDAAAVTPELNHAMMAAGDLGESLVQAAAGYESVADMLIAELTAMSLNTSTTAMVAWQGPGGAIYEMTAEQFCAVCGEASAWVRVGQIQAAEVAAAHTAALEMMIPAPACLANRASQAGLVASNSIWPASGKHQPPDGRLFSILPVSQMIDKPYKFSVLVSSFQILKTEH